MGVDVLYNIIQAWFAHQGLPCGGIHFQNPDLRQGQKLAEIDRCLRQNTTFPRKVSTLLGFCNDDHQKVDVPLEVVVKNINFTINFTLGFEGHATKNTCFLRDRPEPQPQERMLLSYRS